MTNPASSARPLTGYALTDRFRKLRAHWSFTPLEAYLFFELIALCNDEGWPEQFNAKNSVLIGALGCSEPGLIKARKTLVAAGLITYIEGQNRRPTAYRFSVLKGSTQFSDLAPNDASTRPEPLTEISLSQSKHLTEGLTEFSDSGSEEGKHLTEGLTEYLTEGLTEFSPYKEQTKRKRKEDKESAAPAASVRIDLGIDLKKNKPASRKKKSPPEESPAFVDFYTTWPRKEGRQAAAKAFAQLSAEDQNSATARAKSWLAAHPNVFLPEGLRFCPHPSTWLNQCRWEDEQPQAQPATGTRPAPNTLKNPAALFGSLNPDWQPSPKPAEEEQLNHQLLAQQKANDEAELAARLDHYAAQPADTPPSESPIEPTSGPAPDKPAQ